MSARQGDRLLKLLRQFTVTMVLPCENNCCFSCYLKGNTALDCIDCVLDWPVSKLARVTVYVSTRLGLLLPYVHECEHESVSA